MVNIVNEVTSFLNSVQDLAKTRKFWVSFAGAVLSAVVTFLASQPELAPLIALLASWGVWRAPNA